MTPASQSAGEPGGRSPLLISAALHALLLIGALLLPGRFDRDEPVPVEIVFYSPEEIERKVAPAATPPEPPEVAELERPEPPAVEPRPEPTPTPVARNEPRRRPRPAPVTKPTAPAAPPAAEVRTDLFAAEPAPRERPRSRPVVAQAGFSAKDTAAAPTPQPNRVVASGSFADPATAVRDRPAPRETVTTASFDDESAGTGARTERSAPRTVASAGFGAEHAVDGAGPRRDGGRGTITEVGFEDGVVQASAPRPRRQPAEAPDTPVVIVSKPRPRYTEEARTLRVEGEVVLEVTFDAGGRLRVHRVVGSLGYGLDEAAVRAAEEIEYTPARRDGRPVDHTATLRVVFRLA